MRRRLLNLLTALSLVLCVAVCALWVRSHNVCDWVGRRRIITAGESRAVAVREVWAVEGQLLLSTVTSWGWENVGFRAETNPWTGWKWDRDRLGPDTYWLRPDRRYFNRLGFGYFSEQVTSAEPYRLHVLALPHWLAAVLLAVLPAAWAGHLLLRRRRRPAGLCPSCGYDLRATPGQCPECGTENRQVIAN